MERLKQDFIQLNKALESMNNALIFQKESTQFDNKKIVLAAEDSTIKRFEYTYESFWKFLKKYLELMFDLKDINSPKKVFRASVEFEICNLQEGSIFIDMADSRNETSHKYSIEESRAVLTEVSRYYENMIIVAIRIGKNIK